MSKTSYEMYQYRQVLLRMRQGDSDREIARSGLMGRAKSAAVRTLALDRGWLDPASPLPDDETLAATFANDPRAVTCVSTLEPWRADPALGRRRRDEGVPTAARNNTLHCV